LTEPSLPVPTADLCDRSDHSIAADALRLIVSLLDQLG
jgi:hypothetical protein